MTSNTCNGECLIQCGCDCYNEETDTYDDVCVCGHRAHNGYCPSDCCVPVECRNFKYCQTKQPKWVSLCHNGMCINCASQMGKHVYTNTVDECCVCFEHKNMLILKCNHTICNDCWYIITKEKHLCPLCRSSSDWTWICAVH
jgi:hypothetical protein